MVAFDAREPHVGTFVPAVTSRGLLPSYSVSSDIFHTLPQTIPAFTEVSQKEENNLAV